MKVDIHSHILPGVDDGAPDLDTTRLLLSASGENGVTHLALTPHFYSYEQSLEQFLEKRNKAYEKLLSLPEAKNFFFTLGSEVFLTSTLFNVQDLLPLCYEGTDLMLVEPKYEKSFTKDLLHRLRRLISDFGITPVIAHVDRYPFFMSDERLLCKLKADGCMFQANLSSFSSFFSGRKLINFYRKGYLDFLGEDLHRKGLLKQEREKILEKIRKKEEDLLFSTNEKAKALLFHNGSNS